MIPPPFSYHLATSVDDATQALGFGGEDAKYLAGGMSLIPVLKMRLSAPPLLVDIGALRDLSYVRVDGDVVRVGALTRHCDLMENRALREYLPILSDVAYEVGDAQVRAKPFNCTALSSPIVPERKMNGVVVVNCRARVSASRPLKLGREKSDRMRSNFSFWMAARKSWRVSTRWISQPGHSSVICSWINSASARLSSRCRSRRAAGGGGFAELMGRGD